MLHKFFTNYPENQIKTTETIPIRIHVYMVRSDM